MQQGKPGIADLRRQNIRGYGSGRMFVCDRADRIACGYISSDSESVSSESENIENQNDVNGGSLLSILFNKHAY